MWYCIECPVDIGRAVYYIKSWFVLHKAYNKVKAEVKNSSALNLILLCGGLVRVADMSL